MNAINTGHVDIDSYVTVVILDSATDEKPCYLAYHPELEGCMSHGETPSEATCNLREATELYISVLLEKKLDIPIPLRLEGVWNIANPQASESSGCVSEISEIVERSQSADISPSSAYPGVEIVTVA
jgi:predicted RNase H-like HicB family nuclease